MTNNYPEYVNKIIPADIRDEMTDNREESITDLGIAVMGGTTQALTNTQATQAVAIADAVQAKSETDPIEVTLATALDENNDRVHPVMEDPRSDGSGQLVTSESENFWTRLMRIGDIKSVSTAESLVSLPATTLTAILTISADADKIFILKEISFGFLDASLATLTGGRVAVIYNSGELGAVNKYLYNGIMGDSAHVIPPPTKFDGEVQIRDEGLFGWNVIPLAAVSGSACITGVQIADYN